MELNIGYIWNVGRRLDSDRFSFELDKSLAFRMADQSRGVGRRVWVIRRDDMVETVNSLGNLLVKN